MLLDFVKARDALALLSEWRRPEIISVVFLPFLLGMALIVWAAVKGRVTPKHLLSDRALPDTWSGCDPSPAAVLVGTCSHWSASVSTG